MFFSSVDSALIQRCFSAQSLVTVSNPWGDQPTCLGPCQPEGTAQNHVNRHWSRTCLDNYVPIIEIPRCAPKKQPAMMIRRLPSRVQKGGRGQPKILSDVQQGIVCHDLHCAPPLVMMPILCQGDYGKIWGHLDEVCNLDLLAGSHSPQLVWCFFLGRFVERERESKLMYPSVLFGLLADAVDEGTRVGIGTALNKYPGTLLYLCYAYLGSQRHHRDEYLGTYLVRHVSGRRRADWSRGTPQRLDIHILRGADDRTSLCRQVDGEHLNKPPKQHHCRGDGSWSRRTRMS